MLNNNKSVNPEVLDSVFETLNPSYPVPEARQTNKSTPNQTKPTSIPSRQWVLSGMLFMGDWFSHEGALVSILPDRSHTMTCLWFERRILHPMHSRQQRHYSLKAPFPFIWCQKIISAEALEKPHSHPHWKTGLSWQGVSTGSAGRPCVISKLEFSFPRRCKSLYRSLWLLEGLRTQPRKSGL